VTATTLDGGWPRNCSITHPDVHPSGARTAHGGSANMREQEGSEGRNTGYGDSGIDETRSTVLFEEGKFVPSWPRAAAAHAARCRRVWTRRHRPSDAAAGRATRARGGDSAQHCTRGRRHFEPAARARAERTATVAPALAQEATLIGNWRGAAESEHSMVASSPASFGLPLWHAHGAIEKYAIAASRCRTTASNGVLGGMRRYDSQSASPAKARDITVPAVARASSGPTRRGLLKRSRVA
jgi:hypothetical protein